MSWYSQVRDPVHGFIGLDREEVRIVNTGIVQRLREIRQLAMAHLVYPGALHTRFDHTLGVCHVAGLLADSLGRQSEKTLVRRAALLHDIGHGPFSHVSEASLDRFSDRRALGDQVKAAEKIHEALTARMIETDKGLSDVLSPQQRREVTALLSHGYGEPVMRHIVSGPLDADKQDYLLRDSLFCGVRYGVFDISQLHRSLIAGPDGQSITLMVGREGVHSLEQFVLAKYYLTTQVYRHRVRLITDNMLTRAIALGIEVDGIPELRAVYAYDGSDKFIENYAGWNDARFLLTFSGDDFAGTLCHQLVTRLRRRQLLKRVYTIDVNGQEFPDPQVRDALARLGTPQRQQQRAELEMRIGDILAEKWGVPVERHFVILNVTTINSVRVQSPNDEASILVDSDGVPIAFEERSALFQSIDASANEVFLEVYAPVEYDNRTDCRRLLGLVSAAIRSTLEAAAPQMET